MTTKSKVRKAANMSPARAKGDEGTSQRVEWFAAAVSALLFTALVVYLGVIGISSRSDIAVFEITRSQPYERGGMVHVDVSVHNTGSQSAADVMLYARAGGEQVSELAFDFIPSGSTREGTVRLPREVDMSGLDLAVVSYRDP